jgi:predicted MFS family arabinose efflux permease
VSRVRNPLPTARALDGLTARQSWLAVLSIALATFSAVTTEFLPVGLLSDIASDLGVSTGAAGWMVTVPGLVAAVSVPVLLIGFGRFDRRHVMLALTGLVTTSNLVAVVAPSFAIVLLARVLLGVAVGALWTVAPGLGVRLVREHQVPRATALITAGISLGTVLGLPAGTLVGDLAGWRAAFGATAALAGLAFVSHLVLIPALPSLRVLRPRDITGLLRRRAVRIALVLTATAFGGQFAAYTFVEPFLRDETGAAAGTVSVLLLLFGGAGLSVNLALSTVVGARPVRTTATAIVLMIAATALFPLVGDVTVGAALLLLVWGAGWGIVPLALQLRMFGAVPDAPEGGAGLLVTTVQLSVAAGALVGGLAVDASGPSAAMLLGAASLLASGATLWVAHGTREPVAPATA